MDPGMDPCMDPCMDPSMDARMDPSMDARMHASKHGSKHGSMHGSMKGVWRKKIRKRERGSGSPWFQKCRPWLDGRKKLKPKGLGVHGEVEGGDGRNYMGVRKVLSKIGEAAERACMMGCRVRLQRFMRQSFHPRRFLQLFVYFKLVWSITPP